MAQDDNTPPNLRGPPPGATEPPDHVKKPQIYEVFHPSTSLDRSDIASASPAGTSTEGQPNRQPRPTFKDGIESIKSDDFLKVHHIPCAREGLMTGIGAGAVLGMGRYFTGARAPKAANWAFGAFLLGSIVQWEYCQAQRRKERAAMARVVEVIDRKQAEKKAQAAEAARLKQEAEEKAQQAQKSWYKFW
ncbi:hypothetical protein F5B22DRAFT_646288 [Xylaria bambusicola]|uniref:uncharacterized protein n=1 Tax=Xylaria bambusicola TaxID=326684 RepID=UPI002007E9D9|nr:uncharacterized protein F5B22DRAFT_646288 [Xylaria bambusicola]KAI0516943.1 hypothetical protein F5B22DRAFT_646288 [Xylaria bambusicola]